MAQVIMAALTRTAAGAAAGGSGRPARITAMRMPPGSTPSAVGWLCAALLLALAVRSIARLVIRRTHALAGGTPVNPGAKPRRPDARSSSGSAGKAPEADAASSTRADKPSAHGDRTSDTAAPAAATTSASCAAQSPADDLAHAGMALGMAAMVLPLGVPPLAFELFFGASSALALGGWTRRAVRRRLALRRGAPPPCVPAHALEPHHLVVGLAMIAMAAAMPGPGGTAAAGSSTAGMAGMSGMPGMSSGAGTPGLLGLALTVSLGYVWVAAVVLGAGLVRVMSAAPFVAAVPGGGVPGSRVAESGLLDLGRARRGSASGVPAAHAGTPGPHTLAGLLDAPALAYGCELAMTVVMGVMLLG